MTYLSCFFLFLLFSCTHDQVKQERALKDVDVPSEVRVAFLKRHEHIQENFHLQVIEGAASYEVHFVENGKQKSERFNAKGILVEDEEHINFSDIPEKSQKTIQSYLSNEQESEILEVQKVHTQEFDGYELRTKSKKSKTGLMEYFFNEDGSFHHHEEVELFAIPSLS